MNAMSVAARFGYSYLRGEGREYKGIWLSRFTKTSNANSDAIYVGFKGRKPVVYRLENDKLVQVVSVKRR